jgi:hypothetical protein
LRTVFVLRKSNGILVMVSFLSFLSRDSGLN